jgi:hypothetical protein
VHKNQEEAEEAEAVDLDEVVAVAGPGTVQQQDVGNLLSAISSFKIDATLEMAVDFITPQMVLQTPL